MKKKFYRNIIFSKTPLTTNFRFGDYFQIYPCDLENAPHSKHSDDIPLVIEFWIDEDENPEVGDDWVEIKEFISTTANQTNRLNRITRLLSAVTNHRIYNNTDPETKWGIVMPDEVTDENRDIINNQSSQRFAGLYYYPTIEKDMTISEFSEQRHDNSLFFPHTYYYFYDPIDSKKKQITFPKTIYEILYKYYHLDIKSRKVVDTIAHLICHGIDLKTKMKSMSFLSFVSAIETLVNYEFKDQKDGVEFDCPDCQTVKASPIGCPKCGRPIWGVKAKFKTFLKTYVAKSDGSVKKYNRIYNLRSDIIHNGLLLLGDEQSDWTKSEKADSQWMTHMETMQLARLSLVNWLLMGPKKTSASIK